MRREINRWITFYSMETFGLGITLGVSRCCGGVIVVNIGWNDIVFHLWMGKGEHKHHG